MRSWIARRILRRFAERYGYDVSYLTLMLNESPRRLLQVRANHEGVAPP
jgi:hypothetical protein